MKEYDPDEFKSLKTNLLATGRLAFRVVTGSMKPVIKPGDVVEIVPVNTELRKFDIIIFDNSNVLVCHYIWKINQLSVGSSGPTITTRGLYAKEDLPVSFDRVLGKVVSHKLTLTTRLRLVLSR